MKQLVIKVINVYVYMVGMKISLSVKVMNNISKFYCF